MKKYERSTVKLFAILSIACILMILIGIALFVINSNKSDLGFLLLMSGSFLGMLFVSLFLSEKRTYILMDEEKIIFPLTRVPKLKFKRMIVLFNDIKRVKMILYKGDNFITADTYMYTFILKNGIKFSETLFPYGKEQEQEILAKLQDKVKFVYDIA